MNNYYDERQFNQTTLEGLPKLSSSEFVNCIFTSIDFTNLSIGLCKFIDCQFISCNLSNVNVKNTVFRDVSFTKSKLMGINWCEAQTMSSLKFSECVLEYCVFQSLSLVAFEFIGCSLKEADFYEANLSKSNFSNSILTGANFNKANLTTGDFRGASDYFIDLRVTVIKKAKFSLPEALDLLKALDIVLE
jgi:fluoroquinolone resistance protein